MAMWKRLSTSGPTVQSETSESTATATTTANSGAPATPGHSPKVKLTMWKHRMSSAGPLHSDTNENISTVNSANIGQFGSKFAMKRISTAGPSFNSSLFAKRFSKRLSSRFMKKEFGTLGSSSTVQHEKEPTYRMEPKKKFSSAAVERTIKSVMEDNLAGLTYNPTLCSSVTKDLTDEIRDQVKQMGYDRYKIVATALLTQRHEQSLIVGSRCNWDDKKDNFASYTVNMPDFSCTASVYGLYRD